MKRLHRNVDESYIGGVCSGIADYFEIDPSIIRIVWALTFCMYGFGALLYIIMWCIIPGKSWNS